MATLEQLIANVAKIRGFVGVYLDLPTLNAKQAEALRVDLAQLDKNLAALAAYIGAPAGTIAAIDPAVPPPPADDSPPYQRSQAVFGAWASAWLAVNFDDSTSLQPVLVAAKAKEQGVLAAVTAAGLLGFPNGQFADEGDWSQYTAFSWTAEDDGTSVSRVWIMGKLVAEDATPDAYGLALANGIEG